MEEINSTFQFLLDYRNDIIALVVSTLLLLIYHGYLRSYNFV